MKTLVRIVLVLLLVLPLDIITQNILSPTEYKRKTIIWESENYLGLRYKSYVKNTTFDCSGFVNFILGKSDIKVSRSSRLLINDGKRVNDLDLAKPGDVIVFKGRNAKSNTPGHVGLVHHWENDTLYFVHSAVGKGVSIDHVYDPYYAKRFLQVRNVIGD